MSVKVYVKMAHTFWCANEACAAGRASLNPSAWEQDDTIYWKKKKKTLGQEPRDQSWELNPFTAWLLSRKPRC